MRIDVSDLFDRLFDVAYFAREHFDPRASLDESERSDQWFGYCGALSNALFLPACAARAFSLTHTTLPVSAVKPRLITTHVSENGKAIAYLRYEHPCEQDSAFRSLANRTETNIKRRKSKIDLWLGKLPPERVTSTPPAYPAELDAPLQYFCRQYFGSVSHSPFTTYYEFHGEWCLRRIEQRGATFVREVLNGQWLQPADLTEIPDTVFQEVWEGAIDRQPDDTTRW